MKQITREFHLRWAERVVSWKCQSCREYTTFEACAFGSTDKSTRHTHGYISQYTIQQPASHDMHCTYLPLNLTGWRSRNSTAHWWKTLLYIFIFNFSTRNVFWRFLPLNIFIITGSPITTNKSYICKSSSLFFGGGKKKFEMPWYYTTARYI